MQPPLRLRLHSQNPFLWVSAVRHALRRAGVNPGEIQRFSSAALSDSDPEAIRRVCASWAEIDWRPEGSPS